MRYEKRFDPPLITCSRIHNVCHIYIMDSGVRSISNVHGQATLILATAAMIGQSRSDFASSASFSFYFSFGLFSLFSASAKNETKINVISDDGINPCLLLLLTESVHHIMSVIGSLVIYKCCRVEKPRKKGRNGDGSKASMDHLWA